MDQDLMQKIVALCKRRGFIYPGSEIYGGLANTYDYGAVGVELLRNIKNLWWKQFIQKKEDIVGLDASIISSHQVWDASGHTTGFSDAMIDCKECKSRYRADHLIEEVLEKLDDQILKTLVDSYTTSDSDSKDLIKKVLAQRKVEGIPLKDLDAILLTLRSHGLVCPKCNKSEWTPIRKFNLLFPVHLGIIEGDQSLAYLRGETAQGIFINFKNVMDSTRVKLPFGIGQIGKSFRNEITLGNSVFRTIEFEQGEIEYFFDPEVTDWEKLFDTWKEDMWKFITKGLGINEENIRWRTHTDEERSFYSKKTEDLEYKFPFGFKELWGLAYRTDYDLSQHMKYSGKDLSVVDSQTGKKIVPHVIEPAVGINRLMLMVLVDAYKEKEGRIWLQIDPKLTPIKVAIFPLLANKPQLVKAARQIYDDLKEGFMVAWDERGNIGKRYASQDEIGTPFCITVDFQSLEDKMVTIRDRDSASQKRVKIVDLEDYLSDRI